MVLLGGGGGGDLDVISKISTLVMTLKSMGLFANGDPFLAKLKEIDRDIMKFDCIPSEKSREKITQADFLDQFFTGESGKVPQAQAIVLDELKPKKPIPIGPNICQNNHRPPL